MILIFHSFKGFSDLDLDMQVFQIWKTSGTTYLFFDQMILIFHSFKDFSDMEDFLDDLPVSRLKFNALDHFDFQEVFQTTSRKSSGLPGSLPGDFQEVFQTTSRKSSRRLPGSRLDFLEVFFHIKWSPNLSL
ncbi:hypothetical protein DY000_02038760 [Brassica cretica]|uniref:Uncharacterized protein n=1 Tax=Brassica cretica TaxID=69181 RepID=A0ABQ7B5X7_BRACR|nr:hypothetical protein DY000_02038760 [Brassica cretica]